MSHPSRVCTRCQRVITGPAIAVDADPESDRAFRFQHKLCHTPAEGRGRHTRQGLLIRRIRYPDHEEIRVS
jgi:hypothetical protein